jgi:hypothetical protein
MTDAYDLRSNIKGKAGSQGTLFQVKDKSLLNPEQRWPQGYTPDRLNTVREATRDIRVSPVFASGRSLGELRSGHSHERFDRMIARSTVPTEDLQGLREVDSRAQADHHATYYPREQRIGIRPEIPDHEANLIHELGHHVDNMRARSAETMEGTTRNRIAAVATAHAERDWAARGRPGSPNSTALSNAVASVRYGMGEGYADNYYVEHYRSPGRNGQSPAQGRYEDLQGEHLDTGYPGYRDVRPAPHMGPQFHQGELF